MINHGLTLEDADRLLDPIIEFPEINTAFERLRPITDFRKDDTEARVLYICRRRRLKQDVVDDARRNGDEDELYVLKCKVQCVLVFLFSPLISLIH